MIRITHPHPLLGRQTFLDVEFVDGVAEVDELHPERAQAFAQHGFTVETHLVGIRLEDLTPTELRDMAGVEGIDLPAKAKKAEIIAAIEAAPGIPVLAEGGIVSGGIPWAEPETGGETYIPLHKPEAS